MISILAILFMGIGITLPLGKRIKLSWVVGVGMTGLLIITNWLTYTKNIPIRPFLGVAWLQGAFIPMFLSLPFWFYQELAITKMIIKGMGYSILVFLIAVQVGAFLMPLKASEGFDRRVSEKMSRSVIPSYGSGIKLDRESAQGGGMETAMAYLLSTPAQKPDMMYSILLIIAIFVLGGIFTLKLNWDWRYAVATVIAGFAMAVKVLMFTDLLSLMWFAVLIYLWSVWSIEGRYAKIIHGLIWTGLLIVNPLAAIFVVSPIALLFKPKACIVGWVIALLIAPLMVGAWI